MDRRKRWALTQKQNGRCVRCGQPRDGTYRSVCRKCAQKRRLYQRALRGHEPQYEVGVGRPIEQRSDTNHEH